MMWQTKDVRKIIGVNTNTFNTWLSRKAVVPTVPAEGTGTRAEYSFDNVVEIYIMSKLARINVSLSTAKAIAYIASTDDNKNHCYWYEVDEGRCGSCDCIELVPNCYEVVLVFDVEKIRKRVSESMVELNLI